MLDADGKLTQAFRVHTLPTNILLDRQRTVRYLRKDFLPSAIDRALQELLGK